MKVIKTNDTIHLYRDDVETYDRIPVGTYTICFTKNTGFYLTTRNDMTVEEKIYGCHPEKAFFASKPRKGDPIRGYLWLQGYCVDNGLTK